jgi:hypothetical protein
MQVNIDTALVKEAIERLTRLALAEAGEHTILGEAARRALMGPVQEAIARAGEQAQAHEKDGLDARSRAHFSGGRMGRNGAGGSMNESLEEFLDEVIARGKAAEPLLIALAATIPDGDEEDESRVLSELRRRMREDQA